MNRRLIIAVLIGTMLTTLACTININVPTMETINTRTVTIQEPLPQAATTAKVLLSIPSGTFNLAGGASGLIEGTIQYNIKGWDPVISNANGEFSIQQGDITKVSRLPTQGMINNWSLKLSDEIPLDLSIQAGAYKGALDLGGLRLQNLSIIDGASQSDVTFSQPNPIQMENFTYKSGASEVDLKDLANANFSQMSFEGGAGNYTFDLSGDLKHDAALSIKAGISNITLNLPSGRHVIVNNTGAISNIDTQGTWLVNGNTYEASGTGPTITVTIDVAVGNLTLARK